MSAGRYDITLEQGATLQRTLAWHDASGAPVNLTGYTARLDARRFPSDAAPLIELSTTNGRIALGADGTIALSVTAADTAPLSPGNYVYDLLLTAPDGTVTRLLQGQFTVSAAVTR